MRHRRLTRIVRLTLAAGTVALAVGASAASAGALKTGFLDPSASSRGGSFELNPSVSMPAGQAAGGKLVRLYLYWRGVSPTKPSHVSNPNDPRYHWNASHLEDNVNATVANGMNVMLTIRSAPNWAQRGGHDTRGTHNPDPAMLKQFTRAATAHFPNVRVWGVWNEPNYSTFLSPQYRDGKLVSPGMYRHLLNAAASVIHAKNDQNLIVAGETAPFSHWNSKGKPTAPGPLLFLRKLLCMSGGSSPKPTCKANVHADIWATHPYTSGNAWHHAFNRNDVSFGDLPQWQRLIRAAAKAKHITNRSGGHGVRFWITEFSWDTKPPDPTAVPTSLHARWTSEALYRTWQLGIETLLWGQLRDYPIGTDPFFGQYQSGLYYCDSTPSNGCSSSAMDPPGPPTEKPSLTAFRFPFVAYASSGHIKLWGRTPNSTPGAVTIQRQKSNGQWTKIATATAKRGGIFTKTFSSGLTKALLRATVPGKASWKFSLVRPKDRFVNPFGCGGNVSCP